MTRTLAALAALSLVARAAAADPEPFAGKSVLVVPFAGDGSAAERGALTTAAVKGLRSAGARAEMVESSASDLIAIHGCGASDWGCLETIPETLAVDVVIFGDVRRDGDRRTLLVTRLEPGKHERFEIELGGDGADAQRDEAGVERRFSGAKSSGEAAAAPSNPAAPGGSGDASAPEAGGAGDSGHDADVFGYGTHAPTSSDTSLDYSRVEPWVWGVAGGGAGAVLVGGLFLVAGSSVQGDIDSAPTETADDLDRLADLEGKARLYYGIGNTLAIAGLVSLGVGAGLIFYQASSDEGPSVSVAPTPSGSGTGAMLTIGWSR